MRKIKAYVEVNKAGKVVGASTSAEGYLTEEDRSQSQLIEGYILVPLKKNRGRNKGSEFERVVAKKFSSWLYGREDLLRRTPLSGGWGQDKMGDVCIDPSIMKQANVAHAPNVMIECKFQEGILANEFANFAIGGHKTRISKWLAELSRILEGHERPWFLVIKDNHASGLVITNKEYCGIEPPIIIGSLGVFPLEAVETYISTNTKERILG